MSNAAFTTKQDVNGTIVAMHDSMQRLYAAMKELTGIQGQSNVAAKLNVSPQRVKNWESRGVSRHGALDAQDKIGISATWIRNNTGSMRHSAYEQRASAEIVQFKVESAQASYSPLIQDLIKLALTMDDRGLAQLIERAEVLAARFPVAQANVAN